MKLVWLKFANSIAMRMVPRAELTPEEFDGGKENVVVDLSRSKNGQCVFSLKGLSFHDHHSPLWATDGGAPPGSSNPDITAQGYMDRIRVDIEAAGLAVTVEIKALAGQMMADSPYDAPDNDWEKYGADAPKGEDEGEGKEGEDDEG